ncbi:MAG: exodeoxyribonuclease III [Planctomycetota bacterium]
MSWNVNGLRAVLGKGFAQWLADTPVDVLCLQETRALPSDLPDEEFLPPGFTLRMLPAKKKGYSGVAIATRVRPDEWLEGLDVAEFDKEGRFLAARYGEVVVASAYFPNSQGVGLRLDYRLGFGAAVRAKLKAWRARGWHVVLAGDYNVAHQPIDLARPKENEKQAGYLPAERAWMTEFLGDGFVDTWRRQHPTEVGYSWWSQRGGARARNVGWRLDYLCVDEALWPAVESSSLHPQVTGSDHCPVGLVLEGVPRR